MKRRFFPKRQDTEQRLLTLDVNITRPDGSTFAGITDRFNVPVNGGGDYVRAAVTKIAESIDGPQPGNLTARVTIDGELVAEVDDLSKQEVTKARKLLDKMFDDFTAITENSR